MQRHKYLLCFTPSLPYPDNWFAALAGRLPAGGTIVFQGGVGPIFRMSCRHVRCAFVSDPPEVFVRVVDLLETDPPWHGSQLAWPSERTELFRPRGCGGRLVDLEDEPVSGATIPTWKSVFFMSCSVAVYPKIICPWLRFGWCCKLQTTIRTEDTCSHLQHAAVGF